MPFSVTGTNYAGPFICKKKGKRDIKIYLLLLTCSLTRAVHLEILPNQTTQEIIQALKRLTAKRGRPKVIYSDNNKTFEKASKWIKRLRVNEFKPWRNAAAIAEIQIRDAVEANKNELWSSLFDPFRQIVGEWRKSRVINRHRNYCRWQRETFSWSYK